ncbi:MAG: type II toxin-antitoxin system Phd/YefM family antitoxin [Gammaproteobacteria bacterium]
MHTVGAFEAKTHFSALLEEVEKGDQILITKHGRLVAKLVPPNTNNNKEEIQQAIVELKNFAEKNILGMDWTILRDEGRK